MVPRIELLAILALILLRTAQASPGPPIPSDSRANQGDLSPIGRLRFRLDIQDTTAPIFTITTPHALDNSARKVGIPEAIQVRWQDENGKDNEYPVIIRRNPLMPPKEPPVGQSSDKSCNSKKLGGRPTKFRMRAREIFEEGGADRAMLGAIVPTPPHVPELPSMSPSVGKEEDPILKTPLSRRPPGEKDPYPNPDWFPLKPEKRPPPPPVRRGGVNAAADVPNAKDPSPKPKYGPWISVWVLQIMRLQYREKAAGERNNKASQTLDLKATSPSDPLSGQALGAEDNIGGGISSSALPRREPISTSKLNQRSEADANRLPKRATVLFIPPQPVRRPKQERPLRDNSEQRNSLCGGAEQSFGKSEACIRWVDGKSKRSL